MNLFCSTGKKIIFFYGLPVGGTNEKKREKKKNSAGKLDGLLPIFQPCVTIQCIV